MQILHQTVARPVPRKDARRQQMINKGTACDKVRNFEAAHGKTGAAAEPEKQPARRADRHIERDREWDRDDIMLDEAAERDEYRRTRQADPIRWSRNVTDKAAEH